jgi:hypothetical protein
VTLDHGHTGSRDLRDGAVILGYYALSAAEVDVQHLAEADRKRLPCYPIPAFAWDAWPAVATSRAEASASCLSVARWTGA